MQLIVGLKGTGKTKTLIEEVNRASNETKGVVAEEYKVAGFGCVASAFVCGILPAARRPKVRSPRAAADFAPDIAGIANVLTAQIVFAALIGAMGLI